MDAEDGMEGTIHFSASILCKLFKIFKNFINPYEFGKISVIIDKR